MSGPVCKLGGVVLGGADSFDWEIRAGVLAVERTWLITKERAEQLQEMAAREAATANSSGVNKALTLELGDRKFSGIYVLEVMPGKDPFTRYVRVADRRWWWQFLHVSVDMNVKRASGDRFLVNSERLENAASLPEIKYAKWSLYPPENPAIKWTPATAIDWIVTNARGLNCALAFDDPITGVEIEDLRVDDSGTAAIERVLAYVPGADIYLDAEGVVRVFDTLSKRENEVLPRLARQRAEIGDLAGPTDRRAIRPRNVVVLFTPELEMRFDYSEGSTRQADTPVLSNVGPVPDTELDIGDRVVGRGTWLDLETMFTAWGAFGYFNKAVSFEALRFHAFKYGFAQFEQAWANDPRTAVFNSVYAARARVAAQFWRRAFRIDSKFWQRIASIRPVRLAVLDYSTGAFAPAEAFCDYTRRPSMKGLALINDQNTAQGWAVEGYATLLADTEPAPVRVSIADHDSGIIGVTPIEDVRGESATTVLGFPVLGVGGLPKQGMGDGNVMGAALYATWSDVVLRSTFQLAVVCSIVPASPSDNRRFYAVEVSPAEAGVTDQCSGPTAYVRVYSGVTTARFCWRDEKADQIKGVVLGTNDYREIQDDCLVNGVVVRDVARAAARRFYEPLMDRLTGTAVVDAVDPAELTPRGAMSSVAHLMTRGVESTAMRFTGVRVPADINRFLDASTRKAINQVLTERPAL